VVVQGWHPYNSTVNGTGTGLVYDFGVSGAVASVATPDFVDGYEYRLLLDELGPATGTNTLNVELYRETAGTYSVALSVGGGAFNNNQGCAAELFILTPRRVSNQHAAVFSGAYGSIAANGSLSDLSARGGVSHATEQKLLRARFAFASGNIGRGKIYMQKRMVMW
jgi:hypothetical protein